MNSTQASTLSEKEEAAPVENLAFGEDSKGRAPAESWRGEVDTSAPFESVKEAVNRFGGSAVWNSQLRKLFLPDKLHFVEEFEVLNVEEQADQLEKDLIVKEPEILDLLNEFESTKIIADDLKSRSQNEPSEVNRIHGTPSGSLKFHPVLQKETENLFICAVNAAGTYTEQSSGAILYDLKLAKMNLHMTTCVLAKIRAFIESLDNQIQSARTLQGNTPEKLSSLGTIVSFLEEDLRQTTLKLQMSKDAKDNWNGDPADISREIELLRSQTEQFRQTAAAAKSEASNLTSEIEQMQNGIKTAEIRWLAAKKMEEAANAAETVALGRIKSIISSNSSTMALPVEEKVMKAHEFEEHDDFSSKKIGASMLEVETANLSKLELLAKVKEAAADVKTSRKVLEEALNRVEAPSSGKLADEEALWRWPEHGEIMQSYSRMLEFNDFNLASHTPKGGFKHALSIGEILSKKLMGLEEYEHAIAIRERPAEKAKVSLGQILNRRPGLLPPRLVGGIASKQQDLKRKRKKFGFVVLSQLLIQECKPSKSKKRRQVLLQVDTG